MQREEISKTSLPLSLIVLKGREWKRHCCECFHFTKNKKQSQEGRHANLREAGRVAVLAGAQEFVPMLLQSQR